jgi:hypothetical protein
VNWPDMTYGASKSSLIIALALFLRWKQSEC